MTKKDDGNIAEGVYTFAFNENPNKSAEDADKEEILIPEVGPEGETAVDVEFMDDFDDNNTP